MRLTDPPRRSRSGPDAGSDAGSDPSVWDRFWFTPAPVGPLVALRIVLGLLVAASGLSLLLDATAFLGPEGVLPTPPRNGLRIGLLHLFRSDTAAIAVVAAMVPAGLAMSLGLATRGSSLLAWLLLLSVARRNPWIINSGDALLRTAVLFVALSPAGAGWSMDRWWALRRGRLAAGSVWDLPVGSVWALRLLQLQVSYVYLWSALEKVRGAPWMDGSALSMVWRVVELVRLPVPFWAYDSALVSSVLSLGTIAVELALALLLWNRAARSWLVPLGLALHLGIELTMQVGFFSLVIVACYLAFADAEVIDHRLRLLLAAAKRVVSAGARTATSR